MSWKIIGDAPPGKDRHRRVVARCECGTTKIVVFKNIKRGQSDGCRSCGHLGKVATHGQSKSPEYRAWCLMITRCTNPNRAKWSEYGGRGITVCDRWRHSFENFLADMGRKPSPRHSLDRENNDGNYEPTNCRWATDKQQANNRRKRRYFKAPQQKVSQ